MPNPLQPVFNAVVSAKVVHMGQIRWFQAPGLLNVLAVHVVREVQLDVQLWDVPDTPTCT